MTAAGRGSTLALVGALGFGQILGWGSSWLLLAVLAAPIAADTGWHPSAVLGCLSAAVVVSALAGPRIGALIDRHGGRPVLMTSAVLFAAGLSILAVAPGVAVFALGWMVLGVAMAGGLYEAANTVLAGRFRERARRPMTSVALIGALASTASWPLSLALLDPLGWRGVCLAYAVLHLVIAVPLYRLAIPARVAPARHGPPSGAASGADGLKAWPPGLAALSVILTGAAVVSSTVSLHAVTLVALGGGSVAEAVALGALIGPSHIAARALELAFGQRLHPLWTLVVAMLLTAAGTVLLAAGPPFTAAALVCYGAGTGLLTVARGTVPLALSGAESFGVLVGRMALPGRLAQALCPPVAAAAIAGGNATLVLAVPPAVAAVNSALAVWLLRRWRR